MIDYSEKKKAWEDWHKENPLVWTYFQKFTFEALHQGKKRISHWLIVNRIRWEIYIVTKGDEFKINNNLIAFYARLWQETYPEHKNIFNIRHINGEIKKANNGNF